MKWNIGNVSIDNKIVVAPMAGIGDSAFRRICKEMGAGLIYAEMVSDKAVMYGNQKTIDMLYMKEEERPLVQQIFGSDKESFVKAAEYVEKNMKPDIIDINMGCPVPKVAIKSQAGAALLKDVDKIKDIVGGIVAVVNVPVTVKIRSGWDANSINAIEVAKICEIAGASAICVHARTRSQKYSGKADWNIIKQVKESVSIPVIGNGDVKTCYDAKRMLDETGCDAAMIGRALMGNPFLVKECVDYLEKNIDPIKTSSLEKINICIKHLNYLLEFKNERQILPEMKGHAGWYIKGIKYSSDVKKEVYSSKSIDELIEILNNYKKRIEEEKL